MKLTLQIQLTPDPGHADRLKATVERFNQAADWLAGQAFDLKVANKIELQKTHYAILRQRFGLSAQMAVRCIAQVCEAYKPDKAKRPHFGNHAAMPFDQRMMAFKGVDRVSLLTLEGRVVVPFVMGKYQAEKFSNAKGQCDLVLRKDGKWFLLVTVDLLEGTPTPVTDFIGVDLGLANIATDSDGNAYKGGPPRHVENVLRMWPVLQGQPEVSSEIPQRVVWNEHERGSKRRLEYQVQGSGRK